MKKVEKSVNEMMEWMNNVMNAQAKKSLDQDPVVRAHEIKAKIRVSIHIPCVLLDSLNGLNFKLFVLYT
jgi:heat shock protein